MSETPHRFTLLHLSDFHFSAKSQWDASRLLTAAIRDIAAFHDQDLAPNLIAVTGDVAYAGTTDEFAIATEWFKKLLHALQEKGAPTPKLLFVPGNHDVRREDVTVLARSSHTQLLRQRDHSAIASILANVDDRPSVLRRLSKSVSSNC